MYPNINNECRFDGRMTKDPELSFIPISGGQKSLSKVKFTITVDKNMSKKQRDEAKAKGEPTVDFIPCECVGPKAEVIVNHFKKGKPIKVSATFRSYNYLNKTSGQKVYAYTFDVTDIGFATIDYSEGNGALAGDGYTPQQMNDMFPDMGGMTPIDDGDMPF